MPDHPTYRSQVLDHLGLVAGMCDALGIGNVDRFEPLNSILKCGTARWAKPAKRWCSMVWGLFITRSTSSPDSSRLSPLPDSLPPASPQAAPRYGHTLAKGDFWAREGGALFA